MSSVPWAKEGNATAEGTQEKVWTGRRGKTPLLRRGEAEGWASIGNNLLWSVCMPVGLEGGMALQRQTATVIPDSKGGHGPLPLEISEQKSLAAPFT